MASEITLPRFSPWLLVSFKLHLPMHDARKRVGPGNGKRASACFALIRPQRAQHSKKPPPPLLHVCVSTIQSRASSSSLPMWVDGRTLSLSLSIPAPPPSTPSTAPLWATTSHQQQQMPAPTDMLQISLSLYTHHTPPQPPHSVALEASFGGPLYFTQLLSRSLPFHLCSLIFRLPRPVMLSLSHPSAPPLWDDLRARPPPTHTHPPRGPNMRVCATHSDNDGGGGDFDAVAVVVVAATGRAPASVERSAP